MKSVRSGLWCLVFLAVLLGSQTLCQADALEFGGEVGNGGDTVRCAKSSFNTFEGFYSLDFLLTLQTDNSDLIQLKSWEESRQRFSRILAEKFPDLAALMDDFFAGNPFVSKVPDEHKFIQSRIWDEAPYGLVDIKDERVVRKLPANCYSLKAPDEISVIQSIIRQRGGDVLIYNYDVDNLSELRRISPLQFSFLLIHEFLWDFTEDVNVVRRANRFLHSRLTEKLSPEQFRLSLENIGISFRKFPPPNVCDRTKEVRLALERQHKSDCRDIDSKKLAVSQSIELANSGISVIFPWDLGGLKSTYLVNLSNNLLTNLFEDTFYDLHLSSFASNVIDLSNNRLKLRSWNFLKPFSSVRELILSGNEIEELPKDYEFIPRILKLDLKGNRLKEFPEALLRALCRKIANPGQSNWVVLHLAGNAFQTLPQEGLNFCGSQGYSIDVHWN